MKKTAILFFVLLAAVENVTAQIGLDTVFGKYPYYFYNWFDDNWNISTPHPGTGGVWAGLALNNQSLDTSGFCYYNFLRGGARYHECAVRMNSDTALTVVGVAADRLHNTAYEPLPDSLTEWSELVELSVYLNAGLLFNAVWRDTANPFGIDTNIVSHIDFHFNLYDTNMNLITSVSKNYYELPAARYIPGGCLGDIYSGPIPVYDRSFEVFFDSPITITGPFYISQTMTYNDEALLPPTNAMVESPLLYCECFTDSTYPYHYPSETLQFRDTLYTGQWHNDYTFSKRISNIFPIIRRPQDTCPQVRDIELFPSGSGHAFLRWARGSNHQGWQVSYGPAGTAPGDGTLLDFSSPISSVIAFDPDSHYVAYVRARCRFARDEWGPWSDSVSIWLGAPNSVDAAALAGSITLSPNPASDEVVVECPVPITAIEAFDEKGACIMRSAQPNTTHLTLTTKHWSPGAYILRIHTPQGVAVRKLVVK